MSIILIFRSIIANITRLEYVSKIDINKCKTLYMNIVKYLKIAFNYQVLENTINAI